MNPLRQIQKEHGVVGSYVILQLQILQAKKAKIKINNDVVSKWNDEWIPYFDGGGVSLIRKTISTAKRLGILRLIETKGEHYIEFDEKFVLNADVKNIKHSNKITRETKKFTPPKDWQEVRNYMINELKFVGDADNIAYEFFNYWESVDWSRKKQGQMKNWHSTLKVHLNRIFNKN